MHTLRPLRLLALALLAGCASAPIDPAASTAGQPLAAAAVETPSSAPAAVAPLAPPAATESTQTEGTKVLFLRLGFRTRRIEQELLRLQPEGLVTHLEWAAQILRELRQRPLTPEEGLRADRMEQYLQRLVEQYALLQMQGKIAP